MMFAVRKNVKVLRKRDNERWKAGNEKQNYERITVY